MELGNKNRRNNIISALNELGKIMQALGKNQPYGSFSKLLSEEEYTDFQKIILREQAYNGWFTPLAIKQSLFAHGEQLLSENLAPWVNHYEWSNTPKRVGIIMAGNIPLVGFNDFICTLLSGHHPYIKLSSNDQRLLPNLLKILELFLPDLFEKVKFVSQLKDIDAIIATGRNNSSRYFERYFGHLPHIIRKNRTSVAVLRGDESLDDLKGIGSDIFDYYGLGCRNVSKLLLTEEFDLNRFFEAVFPYKEIINHHKYANNYDYYKTIYLMNRVPIIENGFLITTENKELFAPISVVYTHRFSNEEAINDYLFQEKNNIQVIVGRDFTPFGKAQKPSLMDYADGVDTMLFLNQL
ncbi:MAG: acyl-CoA reductase [Crocinitomicaceae bacterium]|nr:acyl-CoA reductase [Crocinitomicaceae bacterium]